MAIVTRLGLALLTSCLLLPASAFASITLGTPNTSALSQGLVGYWPLDGATINWKTGTILDMSGQNKNLAPASLSTTTSVIIGRIGQALKFTGAQYALGLSPNTSVSNWTLSEWIKPAVLPQLGLSIYNGNDSGGFGFGVGSGTGTSGSKLQVLFGSVSWLDPGYTLSANTWYHVVMTRDSGTTRVYVNGVQLATTFANTPGTVVNKFTVGDQLDAGNAPYRYFNGIADEARIYNRALSAQEVALLYAAGNANVGHSNTNVSSGIGLNAGLVGYWTLDGADIGTSFIDRSGNGLNGYLVGTQNATSSRKTFGKIGQAFTFVGQNTGGINLGNSASLTPTRFTIAAWINPSRPQAWAYNYIYSSARDNCQTGVNGIDFKLYGSGNLSGIVCNGGVAYGTSVVSGIATSTWAHVAYSYDGSNARLYVNGVLKQTTAITTDPGTPATYNTYIGSMGYVNGSSYTLYGKLDDVRLYNRALSNAEIAQLAAQGSANVAHSNTATQTGINSGLVGYWTFDGPNINWKTGLALDSSGNGNNGSLVSLGTTTAPAIGKIGQALTFSGSNEVPLGAMSALTTFTVSAWVRFNATLHAYDMIFASKRSGGGNGIDFRFQSGQLRIYSGGGVAGNYVASPGTYSAANGWMFVVAVRDAAGNGTLYVNGVGIASAAITAPNSAYFSTPLIGNYEVARTDTGFQGSIDDVRVYNRGLSAQEVQQLYSMGK